MRSLFQLQYQIGRIGNRECHFFIGALHLFYFYTFFKEWPEDFFTPNHQFAVVSGSTAIVKCFTDTFYSTFFGKNKCHRAVFAFGKIIISLNRLMDIGSSYHRQIFVQTPLNGFGHKKSPVGYLDAVHATVIVKLCMLRPPQCRIRLLTCPTRVIPEDKRILFFGLIESVFIPFLF